MTAVMMRAKDKVAVGGNRSWSDMFPTEQVTPQQSLMFMKKLLAVSLSNITYLRAMFPEHAYGDRGLDDLSLKILKDDTSCPGAKEVIRWIKGCFDAIDKNYLRQIILGVFSSPDDEETLIESYSFRFTYNNDATMTVYRNKDKIAETRSLAETKKATISLLRTILVLVQTMKPLPDHALLTMKLFYYDEITPPEYEPPGFQPALTDKFNYETETVNIKAGDVSTPFHTMKVRIRCDNSNFQDVAIKPQESTEVASEKQNEKEMEEQRGDDDNDIIEESPWLPDQESMVTHPDFERNSLDCKTQDTTQPMQWDENSSLSPDHPERAEDATTSKKNKKGKNLNDVDQNKNNNNEENDDYGVKCPCGFDEDDGLMILCSGCKHWQHAVCFKILEENGAPENHICNKCIHTADSSSSATDPHLTDLNDLAAQATCLWRRTLSACLEMTKMRLPLLMRRLGVDNAIADGLVNRLQKERYVKVSAKGKRYGKEVDHDRIRKHGIPRYFGTSKTDDFANNVGNENEPPLRKSANKNSKNDEVDDLTEQTESLAVGSKNKSDKEEAKENFKMIPEPSTTRSRKRTKSRIDDSQFFDVCSSQDTTEKAMQPAAKRLKTSKTAKSVSI